MIVCFHTLGCKVNQYETQAMRRLVEQAGFQTAEYPPATPDFDGAIVINSCTVTGESDRKLRQLLRRMRRDFPQAILVLTGCMPQAFPEAAAALPEADIVLGNAARRRLCEALTRYLTMHQRIVDIDGHTADYEPLSITEFEGHTRAFVKIEDGCNRFCSYCIIPYARGRVRSRPLASLAEEVKTLAEAGYREVVLVGINLTAYGQDIGASLCDAVETACAVPGIERVRLGSLEPDYVTEAVISRLATQPKLCPQFHLSLQSGCDTTLKRMNRHYTTADYAAVCDSLRRAFPHCALTTDIMVGFAGETEEEFSRSLAFVERIGFARLHVFAYSRRPGTPAAEAPDQVSAAVKAERSRRMTAVGEQSQRAYWRTFLGKTVTVLAEQGRPDGLTEGYTDTYIPVLLPGAFPSGTEVTVTLQDITPDGCMGALLPC